MACGSCGGGNRNRATTGPVPAAAPAATLYEVVNEGRVIFRTRDEGIAAKRATANPGSHYRIAGTTTPL